MPFWALHDLVVHMSTTEDLEMAQEKKLLFFLWELKSILMNACLCVYISLVQMSASTAKIASIQTRHADGCAFQITFILSYFQLIPQASKSGKRKKRSTDGARYEICSGFKFTVLGCSRFRILATFGCHLESDC